MNINFNCLKALCMANPLMEEKYMFDKLFDLAVNSVSGKSSLEILMESISLAKEVTEHFAEHYSQDHNTLDAAIDTFCQILKVHKSKKIP